MEGAIDDPTSGNSWEKTGWFLLIKNYLGSGKRCVASSAEKEVQTGGKNNEVETFACLLLQFKLNRKITG